MKIRWYWHGWMEANKEAVIDIYVHDYPARYIAEKIAKEEGVSITTDTVLKYLRKWGTKMRPIGGKNR